MLCQVVNLTRVNSLSASATTAIMNESNLVSVINNVPKRYLIIPAIKVCIKYCYPIPFLYEKVQLRRNGAQVFVYHNKTLNLVLIPAINDP